MNRFFWRFLIFSVLFIENTFALTTKGLPEGTLAKAVTSSTDYLTYAMYAASVLAIISVGFMLFHSIQDAILKHVTRLVALLSLLTLAFSVPTWFGLCITF